MKKKHPVIAITGSSGAGTSTVKAGLSHELAPAGRNICSRG
ncbi:MAG: hypothetical protein ABFS32_18470 [Bacteroidota bacterium]